MELDWLRTFLAVVDRGGFSVAAEQVHRSQSRVSAHIAALERELGATLIDRRHRPARVTRAGDVLAGHAREILGAVGSARSAVIGARELDGGHVTLLSTPCLAAEFLPGPLAAVAQACPAVRFAVLEDGRRDVERRFLDEGVGLAVLPALSRPVAPGLREQVLWRERLCVVVPAGHRLADADGPLTVDEIVEERFVVAGAVGDAMPEAVDLLARRGVVARVVATADCPPTVAALVSAGIGLGLLTEVAARAVARTTEPSDRAVVARPLADPGPTRQVAVYWYDALLGTEVGRILHDAVLAAPPPRGADPVAAARRSR